MLKLTGCVCEVELSVGSLLENVVRRDVALQGQKMAAAPRSEQTHTAMQDCLHRASLCGDPERNKKSLLFIYRFILLQFLCEISFMDLRTRERFNIPVGK